MADNNGRWITVNGTHILVKDGQTPEEAVKERFDDDNDFENWDKEEKTNMTNSDDYFNRQLSRDEFEKFVDSHNSTRGNDLLEYTEQDLINVLASYFGISEQSVKNALEQFGWVENSVVGDFKGEEFNKKNAEEFLHRIKNYSPKSKNDYVIYEMSKVFGVSEKEAKNMLLNNIYGYNQPSPKPKSTSNNQKKKGKEINADDDIVVLKDGDNVVFKGLYDEFKEIYDEDEFYNNFKFDESKGHYVNNKNKKMTLKVVE